MAADRLLLLFIALRVVSWCLLQTSFVPDEYWQGTEVSGSDKIHLSEYKPLDGVDMVAVALAGCS